VVASLRDLVGHEEPRIFTPSLAPLTWETSRGFECIEFAEEVLGVRLLPWQKFALVHALEVLPDQSFRFRTVLLLVARQNGKSTLMQVLSLWRMFVDGAPLIIGTAQNLDIAEEVWMGAVEMAESVPELRVEIENVNRTNGKKALELTGGSRYKVQTASRRGGRGLSGDLILLDELREHQNWDAWSAVTKTTMARAEAQIWAASNAGDVSSVVLGHLRRLAHMALGDPDKINGTDARPDETPDNSLGILEWSATPGCDVLDREAWAQANPSLGHTITERAISSAAKTDPERVFRTEVLCQWVDSLREGVFPTDVWSENGHPDERIITSPVVAIDVRVGMQQSVAIVVAGRTESGADLVDVARYELGADEQWSQTFVVDEAAAICGRIGLTSVVVDKYGENAHLIPLLEQAGLSVVQLDTRDMRNAAVGFSDGVLNGRILHRDQVPLNVAVMGAAKRSSGEGFLWSQARSTADICPLRAATAAWWVYTSGTSQQYDVLDSVF
jgi:phage terminase large subunit-like protein